jgi:RimJ/RimL family protein N-acetyltransferase
VTGPKSVRHPTPGDAKEVGDAHASAWEEGYSTLFDSNDLVELLGVRRTMWVRILTDPEFDLESMLVVERQGQVVGYSHFGSNDEDETQGEVLGFYAHLRVWGTGVSSEMMVATLAELRARSLRPVIVWTHADADRARAFYEKSGFVLTGRKRISTLNPGAIDVPEVEYSLNDVGKVSARSDRMVPYDVRHA